MLNKIKEINRMELLKDKTETELHNALLAELAKSRNELSTAQADLRKASGRIGFLVILANELITRRIDKQDNI